MCKRNYEKEKKELEIVKAILKNANIPEEELDNIDSKIKITNQSSHKCNKYHDNDKIIASEIIVRRKEKKYPIKSLVISYNIM